MYGFTSIIQIKHLEFHFVCNNIRIPYNCFIAAKGTILVIKFTVFVNPTHLRQGVITQSFRQQHRQLLSTNFMLLIFLYYLECVRCNITFNTLINQHVIMCISIGFNQGILSASKITKRNRKILFHRARCLSIHSNGFFLFANDCFYTNTTYTLTQR